MSVAKESLATAAVDLSHISNKQKRQEVFGRLKAKKKHDRAVERRKRTRLHDELGADAPPKQIPRTLDNTREVEETAVQPNDEEVVADEAEDEFAPYFAGTKDPKVMITTRPRPSRKLYNFIGELMDMIPNSFLYKRGTFTLKEICQYASNKEFTHVLVLSEKSKQCNGMIVSHLPAGPTALFKLSSLRPSEEIGGHGRATSHIPEVLLNRFTTRLGHRVGRFLGSLFPHRPDFKGRQVVTFHNQRDFIFLRHHRYVFDDEGKSARLQELGPQCTMKLKWLQACTFDTLQGEYEWVHKRKQMDTSRRKFHL